MVGGERSVRDRDEVKIERKRERALFPVFEDWPISGFQSCLKSNVNVTNNKKIFAAHIENLCNKPITKYSRS